MEMGELVMESSLRAIIYHMEAEMGREEAQATKEYKVLDRALTRLEDKHVSEMLSLLNLSEHRL